MRDTGRTDCPITGVEVVGEIACGAAPCCSGRDVRRCGALTSSSRRLKLYRPL